MYLAKKLSFWATKCLGTYFNKKIEKMEKAAQNVYIFFEK